MSEQEIASRLKEHLQHCINHHGRITKHDKGYCIQYIKDFTDKKKITKEDAEKFYRDKVLYNGTVKSEIFDDMEYITYMDGELLIKNKQCGTLNISVSKIKDLFKELQLVGGVV